MSTRGKLARLERAAGVGVPCLDCNHHSILYGDLIARTRPADLLTPECPACGFLRPAVLTGFTEQERELLREYVFVGRVGRTLAARRRWYALQLYLLIIPGARAIREIGEVEEERLRAVQKPDASTRWQLKVLDEYKAREDIKAASRKRTLEEEAARDSVRAVSSPAMAAIKAVKEAETVNGHARDLAVYWLKLMAGLEPLIFGRVLPETKERIEAREAEIQAEAEREAEAERQRERARRAVAEQRERERLEREEKYRREQAERERERQERMRADVAGAHGGGPTATRQYTPQPDPEGRPLIQIPEIPPPPGPEERARATQTHPFWTQEPESDVSRLPDSLKYRAPRWEGDTDY